MTPIISAHAEILVGFSACCDRRVLGTILDSCGWTCAMMTHLLAVPGASPRLMIGIVVPFLLWNVSSRHPRNTCWILWVGWGAGKERPEVQTPSRFGSSAYLDICLTTYGRCFLETGGAQVTKDRSRRQSVDYSGAFQ